MLEPDHYFHAESVIYEWSPTHRAIAQLAVEINSDVRDAAIRIGDSVDAALDSRSTIQRRSIETYMPLTVSRPDLWTSDQPGNIFTAKSVFNVGSTRAFETPQVLIDEDTLLVAPIDQSGEEIDTHRGIGLPLFSEFMYQLMGTTMGSKDDFIWVGPQVDMEQVMLEDQIAQKGPQLDKEIRSILFTKRDGEYRLHPQLRRTLLTLYDKKWSLSSSPDYKLSQKTDEYVDKLLSTMYEDLGIRDGWYGDLKAIFKNGDTSLLPDTFHVGAFEHALLTTLHAAKEVKKTSHAIAIEFDASDIFKAIPFYVFPMTTRPPSKIVPVPAGPLSAAKAVFTEESPIELPNWLRVPSKSFTDLSDSQLVPNQAGEPVTLHAARSSGSDPESPLCVYRYATDSIAEWAEHIGVGRTAPWWNDINQPNLTNPKSATEKALARLVVDRARDSGLLEQMMAKQRTSEERATDILNWLAGRYITLPSIKTVKSLDGSMNYDR